MTARLSDNSSQASNGRESTQQPKKIKDKEKLTPKFDADRGIPLLLYCTSTTLSGFPAF